MSATEAQGPGAAPQIDPQVQRGAMKAMPGLLAIFVFGILCLHSFNFVFTDIGQELGAPARAALITSLPGVVLGVVSVIYGSLGDFVSLRRMMMVGIALIVVGSVLGLFSTASIWLVIIARVIQTAGCQVAGSVFLVVATKYVPGPKKVVYFGIFTAAYQFSTAIGLVAAGQLSKISWVWLFAIPLLSVFFIPSLYRHLPDVRGEGRRIDIAGFVLVSLAVGSLVMLLSEGTWAWALAFTVLSVAFVAYIHLVPHAFITPEFFRNRAYLVAVSLILIFYVAQYAMNPLFKEVGAQLYGYDAAAMVFVLIWASLIGGIAGMMSGKIVGWIGRGPGIMLAASLMALSCLLAAFTLESGIWAVGLCAVLFFGGISMLYSPVVDTVVGTVDVSESGRAVGLNDLAMNVSPSIGVALVSSLMNGVVFGGVTLTGATAGEAANYSVIFLLLGAVFIAGMVWFLAMKKNLYPDSWGRVSAQA
ncbi:MULTISPECIES: MFS transporter [unclassified Corynebacterium]|uniref:MFS transporter n=1 Tax=unclassified Corynebacterium TaxID=2624378 RepID=UPI0029C9FD05|nr:MULTISPECIES: MFS transporter [unclassified Corynebacterium]WPF65284.1 MFS transporter [Corynebacterium sp. 22KM0430]WPF67779.1 MFS transporter [Corynebacterium sp. 21KM1197]